MIKNSEFMFKKAVENNSRIQEIIEKCILQSEKGEFFLMKSIKLNIIEKEVLEKLGYILVYHTDNFYTVCWHK